MSFFAEGVFCDTQLSRWHNKTSTAEPTLSHIWLSDLQLSGLPTSTNTKVYNLAGGAWLLIYDHRGDTGHFPSLYPPGIHQQLA
jgi:hypothetical protein